eukprot:7085153-Alexandrium_andersonii.AAC.1
MSASLVGSEMCIRDSASPSARGHALPALPPQGDGASRLAAHGGPQLPHPDGRPRGGQRGQFGGR